MACESCGSWRGCGGRENTRLPSLVALLKACLGVLSACLSAAVAVGTSALVAAGGVVWLAWLKKLARVGGFGLWPLHSF